MVIDCKKINLFIGHPDTGKSNILDVLGLVNHAKISRNDYSDNSPLESLTEFVRAKSIRNLCFDNSPDYLFKILIKHVKNNNKMRDMVFNSKISSKITNDYQGLDISHEIVIVGVQDDLPILNLANKKDRLWKERTSIGLKSINKLVPSDYSFPLSDVPPELNTSKFYFNNILDKHRYQLGSSVSWALPRVKFYKFNSNKKMDYRKIDGFSVPYGNNLFSYVFANSKIREIVSDIASRFWL